MPGRFLNENVGPRTCDLTVSHYSDALGRFVETKQSVTVIDAETTGVVITFDISDPGKP
jgi:hypothetical protein